MPRRGPGWKDLKGKTTHVLLSCLRKWWCFCLLRAGFHSQLWFHIWARTKESSGLLSSQKKILRPGPHSLNSSTSLSKALKIISEAPKCVGVTGSKENIDAWINLIKSEPKFVGYLSICIIYMVCVCVCMCVQKKGFILYLLTII